MHRTFIKALTCVIPDVPTPAILRLCRTGFPPGNAYMTCILSGTAISSCGVASRKCMSGNYDPWSGQQAANLTS